MNTEVQRFDASNPVNRRAIVRDHLEELATYLGAEFSGETQKRIVLDVTTDAVLEAFFEAEIKEELNPEPGLQGTCTCSVVTEGRWDEDHDPGCPAR